MTGRPGGPPGGTGRAPVVHVDPLGADLELRPEETIIEAAWRLGYYWPTTCYGQATCGVCHLEVLAGADRLVAAGDEERETLEQVLPGIHRRRELSRTRLACRARATGDVTVRKKGVRRLQTTPIPPAGLV